MSVLALTGRLEDILAAIREIEAFAAGKTFDDYMAEPILRRAVERDVEIISEASRYIPESLKAKYSSIPWRKWQVSATSCATAINSSMTTRCGIS